MLSFFLGKQKTAYEMLRSLVCKQKTAYEMLRSLVGSEMCIRDRRDLGSERCVDGRTAKGMRLAAHCLLYTSDAADEEDSVDLGGRRIIKKKKKKKKTRNSKKYSIL